MFTHRMIRIGTPIVAALFFLLSAVTAQAAAPLGPSLREALNDAAPGDGLEVIVSFTGDGALTASQISALRELGLKGIYFRSLPIAGVIATKSQTAQLATLPGVRSLWLNDLLEYENDGSTEITGVDRARTDSQLRSFNGLPFSGKGVGVLINDSGIDGTHADLMYPTHVVQNVAGQTNLHAVDDLLPITYTEDVPNTDIGSGHGTHVAGIVGATGARSGGLYEGVAPGASLVGYGSGAVIFILDSIGGFDYALTNQARYGIRVVSNSFGATSDVGTDFNPDHPTNIATKRLADRNIVIVFSAGNSGSGESTITGNFKKAPWVVLAAAGNKTGNLANFSSRGLADKKGTVVIDGETFEWEDRPTITTPGVNVISARASTGSNWDDLADETIPLAFRPFYTPLSGTSMSAPHLSGIVALMLEANPQLHWSDVKRILQRTATNLPGEESWETGTGYANAHAAVAMARGLRTDYGSTVNLYRTFNSVPDISVLRDETHPIAFMPVGTSGSVQFTVSADEVRVAASAFVSNNTVAVVLIDPQGTRYGSAISLPLLGPSIAASAPARPGVWTLTVRGIGSVSGVALDPLGLTNGTAVPATINVRLKTWKVNGFTGLSDISGHPAEGMIEFAVRERLVDGLSKGVFKPDSPLTRGQLADYLTAGAGIRQFLPLSGVKTFADTNGALVPFAEATTVRGAAIKDRAHRFDGVIRTANGKFNPNGSVNRADLAYSLVQSLGLQDVARAFNGDLTVRYNDTRIPIEDAGDVPADLRGYVQLALDLPVMNAYFTLEQGPFDLVPKIKARFKPSATITRAAYASYMNHYFDVYRQSIAD
ncbi:MAG: S8 family serine peptidase [Steroidobacteraceae bacterium]